jgi:SAM-dependent methyltransferase
MTTASAADMLVRMPSPEPPDSIVQPDLSLHWDRAYQRSGAENVSWFAPHLGTSLELLRSAGLNAASTLIDVGGGASTLVDDLLLAGLDQIVVLDISEHALALGRARIGDHPGVRWQLADIRTAELERSHYDFWHDRAVLHFLSDSEDLARYAAQARAALRAGGHALIAGFGPQGPERCSGLAVVRRSADDIAQILGDEFELIAQREELHTTPAASSQAFIYALLRRR